jgi:hypothetical protein
MVVAGSFQARDNVQNFIQWARGLGIDDVILFETNDLVERKNEKNVLYRLRWWPCLYFSDDGAV